MKREATPILKALSKEYTFVDNELQDGLKQLKLFSHFARQGIRKRSGDSLHQIIFAVLVFPLLSVKSLNVFLGKFLGSFVSGGKDVVYRFLNRQDINWRAINMNVAKSAYMNHCLGEGDEVAFVVDDSIKQRRGKKVEGVSSHFDHTQCRKVMGQQVLQLGLAMAKGFLPIDAQIYVGSKKVQGMNKSFDDNRSAVAKDYECAVEKNKHEMFRMMLGRALRKGFKARNIVGDTWFGTKGNIGAVAELGMTGIFMMRRSTLKYRFQGRLYTSRMLYNLVRRRMKATKGQRFLTHAIIVEINLAEKGEEPNWVEVKLVFSKSKKCAPDNWVVLLCTNTGYSVEKILRLYALRWSIEVYFKEAKQGMGWLREQSGSYVVAYASIHLAQIRYTLLYSIMLQGGQLTFGSVRNKASGCIERLCFAAVLWELFKALIAGALEQLREQLGSEVLELIKATISTSVEEFLDKALQLDDISVQRQLKAEKMAA